MFKLVLLKRKTPKGVFHDLILKFEVPGLGLQRINLDQLYTDPEKLYEIISSLKATDIMKEEDDKTSSSEENKAIAM